MHAQNIRQTFAPHAHAEYGFGVVLGGMERFRYRGVEHVAGPGTVIAMNPETVHTGQPEVTSGWTYAMAYVSVPALTMLIHGQDNAPSPIFGSPVVNDPLLASKISAFLLRFHEVEDMRLDVTTEISKTLGALVSRHATYKHRDAVGHDASFPIATARDRLEGVAHGETNSPSLVDLAQDTGHSPTSFLRRYTAIYGLPPHMHLRDMRLRRARDFLRRGMTVAETAAATGFADQSHLTRWFKRVTGTTPASYRNGHIAQ